ncbi:penicillin-binding protein [Planosporangium thailandense]|uniref:Penicillin-binding protein n=2 Tax=Planosporangium thailandense TaxID=765197 RepID=A0ABX0XYH0_9ACTN|nr:penicillin-binding protein [Planosporangium thailandense]
MCVAVAVLSYPFAAMVGLTVSASINEVDIQAQQLPEVPPPQPSRLYAADGTTLVGQFSDHGHGYTPLDRVAPALAQAVVADARSDQPARGASTLTRQYVRDVLLDAARTPQELEAASEPTAARELRETQLAETVERKLTRAQILERYLNIAYFGHQAYGIAAAAGVYFSKRPADLTVGEAALLAGLIREPSAHDPAGDPAAAAERRDRVLDRMVALHDITRAAADRARSEPVTLRLSEPPDDCAATTDPGYGYFCDLFTAWWMGQPAFGSSPEERLSRLRRGGYRIVTSLDAALQAGAYRHVVADEPAGSPVAHGLVAIEPGTGRVRAIAVNRPYPGPAGPSPGGTALPSRPAGTTGTLFTMLAALDRNLPLTTSISAPRTGRQTMWSAFGESVDTYFAQLEQQIGADAAAAVATRLGLTPRTGGVASATPLELAGAYATIAADGVYCDPLPVASVTDPDGAPVMTSGVTPVDVAAPRCRQAVRPQVARAAVDAARCVTGYGAATAGVCGTRSTAPSVYRTVRRPVAGGTGTTDDDRTAWFVGFSPALTVASFVAAPDGPRVALGAAHRAAPIRSAAQTLRDGLAGTAVRGFTAPDPTIAYGRRG